MFPMAESLDPGTQEASGTFEAPDTGSIMESEITEPIESCTKMGSFRSEGDPGLEVREKMDCSFRAEIDTSAPIESVKEAASRFGGFGFWRPHHLKLSETQHVAEEVDIFKVEEQAAQLEKDLFAKERETLEVLKELEATKMIVEELKLKLQKEASELNATLESKSTDSKKSRAAKEAEKENHENLEFGHPNPVGELIRCPSSAPGLILMELKQAKLNLTRTTTDLSDIRASVETFNKKIEKERVSLKKTRERITLNSSKISYLEKELNQTRQKLQVAKNAETNSGSPNPKDISRELQRLSDETEQFKKMGEAAKSEVLRAMSEIEQTKSRIKTAEIRLVAAKKMKAAARAAEAVALSEIKTLSNKENSGLENIEGGVTLSFEEYSSLTSKARNADELSKRRVVEAMQQVDEANVSKVEILKTVEAATKEVKTSKKVLEEALNRVEAANRGKLAVEEALRKWRSEHGQKRRSTNKFKNSNSSHHQRDSHLFDVNGLNMASDGSVPVLQPTLSIGQILSMKLLSPDAEQRNVKGKVSLGQMLNKSAGDAQPTGDTQPACRKVERESSQMLSKSTGDTQPACQKVERESSQKQFSVKRKKFGFARFSLLLAKQSKKKKTSPGNAMCGVV